MTPINSSATHVAARSDYAACAGASLVCDFVGDYQPRSIEEGDSPDFEWAGDIELSGLIFEHSSVTPSMVSNGLSNTLLFAEKYLPVANYSNGRDHGDDWSAFAGFQDDNQRTTFWLPAQDRSIRIDEPNCRFGAPHTATFNILRADGSLDSISYSIDRNIWLLMGRRS